MTARKLLLLLVSLGVALPASAQTHNQRTEQQEEKAERRGDTRSQIEPDAGEWRTWVITSGKDFRVPPPPSASETRRELRSLADLISHNDGHTAQQIAFWDAGSPAYRWIDLINARLLAGTPTTPYPHRVYTYVALAMYDATIATWESKYH